MTAAFAHTPATMVAVAVFVAPTTQILKQVHPELRGWRALAMNLFLTVATQLSISRNPEDVRRPEFWSMVLTTSLLACGVHSTGKGLFPGLLPTPETAK